MAFELGWFGFEIGFVDGRSGAKKIGIDPSEAEEVAHEVKVGFTAEILFALLRFGEFFVEEFPKFRCKREVVVSAGDCLHFFAVARGEAFAVLSAFFGKVCWAIFGDFDVFFVG